MKLCKQQCRLDIRKHSFPMRIVNPWNSYVVSAPTIMSFEARLDNVWRNQPMKFNYREDLILLSPGSGHRGVSPASRNVDDDDDDVGLAVDRLFDIPHTRGEMALNLCVQRMKGFGCNGRHVGKWLLFMWQR